MTTPPVPTDPRRASVVGRFPRARGLEQTPRGVVLRSQRAGSLILSAAIRGECGLRRKRKRRRRRRR